MGYGGLFAAVLGAVLADRRRVQLSAALLTLVLASLFGLLFFFLNSLAAAVPVAVAMICVELWSWGRRRADARAASSAYRRPLRQADAINPRVR